MKAELTLPERPAAVHLLAVLDVLVLMLVLFMLLTSITQEAGVSVDLAETGFRLKSYGKPIVVTVRGGARPVVYVGQERVTMEEYPEVLRKAREATGSESMFLRADKMLTVEVESIVRDEGLRQGLNVMLIGRQEEGKGPADGGGEPKPVGTNE